MPKDLFDLDNSLLSTPQTKVETNNFELELRKARALCIRGQYDRALDIYNSILDEDFENEEALIGVLRVHSKDFTEFDNKDIDQDIHAIESMCPDTMNDEYLSYLKKKKAFKPKKVEVEAKPVEKPRVVVEAKPLEAISDTQALLPTLKKAKKYIESNSWKRCIDLIESIYDQYSTNPSVNYYLGLSHFGKHNQKDAITYLEKCLANSNKSHWTYPLANYQLGMIRLQLNITIYHVKKTFIDIEKAKQHFMAARDKAPKYVDVYLDYLKDISNNETLKFLMVYIWQDIFWNTSTCRSDVRVRAEQLIKQGSPYGHYYLSAALYHGDAKREINELVELLKNDKNNKYTNFLILQILLNEKDHYSHIKAALDKNPVLFANAIKVYKTLKEEEVKFFTYYL